MPDLPIVLVTAPIHDEGLRRLRDFDLRIHHHDPSRSNGGIPLELIAQAQAIVVRGFEMTGDLVRAAENLKIVAKHGAGVNNIDLSACGKKGILVTNTGDANSDSVAQLTVALILAAQRKMAAVHASVAHGAYDTFRRHTFPDLLGQKVGIVGFGAIGRRVARICQNGFDAQILAYDPGLSTAEISSTGAAKCEDLDALFAQCDVVSLHVPLTPATRHLASRKRLRSMQPHAVLVNTSRGDVVDESALIEALQEDWIWAAGLDAYKTEPLLKSELFSLSNVILSPHIGGATELSRKTAAMRAADCVIDALAGRMPKYLIETKPAGP